MYDNQDILEIPEEFLSFEMSLVKECACDESVFIMLLTLPGQYRTRVEFSHISAQQDRLNTVLLFLFYSHEVLLFTTSPLLLFIL